jgi:hypothetical protein
MLGGAIMLLLADVALRLVQPWVDLRDRRADGSARCAVLRVAGAEDALELV